MTSRLAFVPLESVWWRSEVSSRETPEDALIAREEEEEDDEAAEALNVAIRAIERDKLRGYLEQLPSTEALALALHLGLLGYPPTMQSEIAATLGVASQQVVAYKVRCAKARLLYLASRPQIDIAVLTRALRRSLKWSAACSRPHRLPRRVEGAGHVRWTGLGRSGARGRASTRRRSSATSSARSRSSRSVQSWRSRPARCATLSSTSARSVGTRGRA